MACPPNFKEPDVEGSKCCIADHIQTPAETTCTDLAKSTSRPLEAYCPDGTRLLQQGEHGKLTCCVPETSLGPWCDGRRCPGGQTCDYSTGPRGKCIPDIDAIDCLDPSAQKVLYIDKAPWSPTQMIKSRECLEFGLTPEDESICYPLNATEAKCLIEPRSEYWPPGYGYVDTKSGQRPTCKMSSARPASL